MKRFAIDLTWVRPGKVGGTESAVRNLLDGFSQLEWNGEWKLILLAARDNAKSFCKYKEFPCYEVFTCQAVCENQIRRVLWQNIKMGKLLKKLKVDVCLEPVYGKPFLGTRGIRFCTTIHDLQAIHYPEYFSWKRNLWMKISWWSAVKTSSKIIAISNFVKEDILKHYHVESNKIEVIYNAIPSQHNACNAEDGLKRYGVTPQKYYYTVSSLLPHKNLKTIVLALAELKKINSEAFLPLVISGIGGKSHTELEHIIKEREMENDVIFTPFIENAERNMLYKNCKVFLFPSIFEGFGMPPVEAMTYNVPVITTRSTSIPEVTGNLLNYVENPISEFEWVESIKGDLKIPLLQDVDHLMNSYSLAGIAEKHITLLFNLSN